MEFVYFVVTHHLSHLHRRGGPGDLQQPTHPGSPGPGAATEGCRPLWCRPGRAGSHRQSGSQQLRSSEQRRHEDPHFPWRMRSRRLPCNDGEQRAQEQRTLQTKKRCRLTITRNILDEEIKKEESKQGKSQEKKKEEKLAI